MTETKKINVEIILKTIESGIGGRLNKNNIGSDTPKKSFSNAALGVDKKKTRAQKQREISDLADLTMPDIILKGLSSFGKLSFQIVKTLTTIVPIALAGILGAFVGEETRDWISDKLGLTGSDLGDDFAIGGAVVGGLVGAGIGGALFGQLGAAGGLIAGIGVGGAIGGVAGDAMSTLTSGVENEEGISSEAAKAGNQPVEQEVDVNAKVNVDASPFSNVKLPIGMLTEFNVSFDQQMNLLYGGEGTRMESLAKKAGPLNDVLAKMVELLNKINNPGTISTDGMDTGGSAPVKKLPEWSNTGGSQTTPIVNDRGEMINPGESIYTGKLTFNSIPPTAPIVDQRVSSMYNEDDDSYWQGTYNTENALR